MKGGLLASVFTLVIIFPSAHTFVPAPFDVKVNCHNFETVVSWNYKNSSLQPLFRVQILKDINNADSETTFTWLHHQNISSSVTHICDSYYVNVSAMNPLEMSASAVSPEFSYHKYFPAEVRCMLDFPNVTLSVKDGQVMFTFPHPYKVYKHTPLVKKLNQYNGCEECKEFKYSVSYNGTDTLHNEKVCKEEVCKETFHVPGNSGWYCVSLSGTELNTNSGIICQQEEIHTSWIYFILIAVYIVVIGSFVIIITVAIAYMRTMKTMPTLPKLLVPLSFKTHPENTMLPKDYNGQIVWPLVSPKTFLLTPQEEVPADSPSFAVPEEDFRFPTGQGHLVWSSNLQVWSSNQEAMHLIDCAEPCDRECSDQSRQWDLTSEKSAEDCADSSLCGGFSGYDRPQVMEVEISPGDIVEGYGPHDHTSQIVL